LLRDAAELPAPENTYQLTSVAAPEVSGIVALLLERNRKLTPANLRRILMVSALAACAGRPRRFRLGDSSTRSRRTSLQSPRTATS
jgi:subtilisin family serine protease